MKDFADISNAVGSWPSVTAADCTGPGETDGTAVIADTMTDYFGFIQALLNEVGETPNDTAESYTSSQILNAIKSISTSWAKNWSDITLNGTTEDFYDLATDGEVIVVVGSGTNNLQYTYNGKTFLNNAIGANTNGIAYGNGYWVAIGSSGTLYYATDPTGSWTSNTQGSSSFTAVAYGNGYWVAVGASGTLYYTTDPTGSWTSNTQGSDNFFDVIYAGGYWVAVGANGALYYATDPTSGSWTSNAQGSQTLVGITYGKGKYVVVANVGTYIYTNTVPSGTWDTQTPAYAGVSTGVAFGNGIFVASYQVATGGDLGLQISSDGESWENISFYESTGENTQRIRYCINKFIAVGDNLLGTTSLQHG